MSRPKVGLTLPTDHLLQRKIVFATVKVELRHGLTFQAIVGSVNALDVQHGAIVALNITAALADAHRKRGCDARQ